MFLFGNFLFIWNYVINHFKGVHFLSTFNQYIFFKLVIEELHYHFTGGLTMLSGLKIYENKSTNENKLLGKKFNNLTLRKA